MFAGSNPALTMLGCRWLQARHRWLTDGLQL